MDRSTWSNERALLFARGLHYVAACDGLHPTEADALLAFMERVGLPPDLSALTGEPFDVVAAAALLDSTWLRRTFLRACRFMARMDGQLTPQERDILRGIAVGLGLDEPLAYEELDDAQPQPQDLVAWVSNLAVDFVSWDTETSAGYFWSFPHREHPLAEGGKLIVGLDQALVIRAEEQIVEVLPPGQYTVSPRGLPGLTAATGWRGGPVTADLVYLRTAPSQVLRWGTVDPAIVKFPGRGDVAIRAFGRFTVRFSDPRRVVERMARQGLPSAEEVDSRLRRILSGRFSNALAAALEGRTDEEIIIALNDLDTLETELREQMKPALQAGGLTLVRWVIETLTAPLELGLQPTSRRTASLTRVGQRLLSTRNPTVPATPSAARLRACWQCATPNPISARFCANCGSPQRRACVQCSFDLPYNARFCSHCGATQPTGPTSSGGPS